jgi:hypothetical protein
MVKTAGFAAIEIPGGSLINLTHLIRAEMLDTTVPRVQFYTTWQPAVGIQLSGEPARRLWDWLQARRIDVPKPSPRVEILGGGEDDDA